LPGPFAPMELGREGRLENSTEKQTPLPHWAHPDQVRQYTQGTGSEVPQTPAENSGYNAPVQTPYKPRVRPGTSPSLLQPSSSPQFSPEDTPTRYGVSSPYTNQALAMGPSQRLYNQAIPPRVQSLVESSTLPQSQHVSRTPTPSLDFSGLQAQIDAAHDQAAVAARETLTQIFPSMDVEVVEWVLEANEGDLGKSIEALLEMSNGS
jgi:Rab5 GDP/GTP exchange factor